MRNIEVEKFYKDVLSQPPQNLLINCESKQEKPKFKAFGQKNKAFFKEFFKESLLGLRKINEKWYTKYTLISLKIFLIYCIAVIYTYCEIEGKNSCNAHAA